MQRQRLLFSVMLVLSLPWVFASKAMAQDRAQVIRLCVNGLLYGTVSADGVPELSSQTDFPERWVARTCRPVRTLEGAKAKRICVNGLLYQAIAEDGSPQLSTKNEDIMPSFAVRACDGVYRSQIALEQRRCVNGLLYRTISARGEPRLSSRTTLSVLTAVENCALPQSVRPRQAPQRRSSMHHDKRSVLDALHFSQAFVHPQLDWENGASAQTVE